MSEAEFDFSLVIGGVPELDAAVEDSLFKAGCDDATFSIRHGLLFAEFSRQAPSLKDAVLSAIRDIRRAGVGAQVLRVDESDLVTPAEIARKIGRSRQLVHQYMSGARGPGGFPPPACHLADDAPLWSWSQVSEWLAQNSMIRPQEQSNARVIAIINNSLEAVRQRSQSPQLFDEVAASVAQRKGQPAPKRRLTKS
jgi:hypothetical protein